MLNLYMVHKRSESYLIQNNRAMKTKWPAFPLISQSKNLLSPLIRRYEQLFAYVLQSWNDETGWSRDLWTSIFELSSDSVVYDSMTSFLHNLMHTTLDEIERYLKSPSLHRGPEYRNGLIIGGAVS
jgi:hypothetical protein